jgi:hypothetical protein
LELSKEPHQQVCLIALSIHLVNITQLVPSGLRCGTSAARVIGWLGWNVGVDADEDMANDEGAGKGGGGVAVNSADVDADVDVDDDGEDERPLVTVDDMKVGDCDREWAGVAVEAEAEDDVAEVDHVGILWGAGPITCSSKQGHKRV